MLTLKRFIFTLTLSCIIASTSYANSVMPLSVMTFNIENGGTQVDFDRVVLAIKQSGADMVGIQEAWGHTPRLAHALGWKYYDKREHILSRYPLFEALSDPGTYVLAEVKPGQFVAMANMHLPDDPYGPDLIKQGADVNTVIKNEEKVRLPTALPFINSMASFAEQGMPVFLTGDFNSPSSLDWTANTVNVLPGHRYAIAWPVTKTIGEKGLVDSYRAIYPDPIKYPSYTWPSKRPIAQHSFDGFNPSSTDLPVRIDFIFTGGHSKVIKSYIVGEAHTQDVTISIPNPWPSDHRAVVSRFEVIPASYPMKNLTPVLTQTPPTLLPHVRIAKKVFHQGEPIIITWSHAPGNRYDYVSILPVGSKNSSDQTVRLYTHAYADGSVTYAAHNAKGNWTAWHKTDAAAWPLAMGKYEVKLMSDDGYTVLAKTQLTITK